MRIAYVSDEGRESIAEVSNIEVINGANQIIMDDIVFDMPEKEIKQVFKDALEKGFADLRPYTPSDYLHDGSAWDDDEYYGDDMDYDLEGEDL